MDNKVSDIIDARCNHEIVMENNFLYKNYVVFAALEAILNENHISSGKETEFKNSDLLYSRRAEYQQCERIAPDLPEINYKAVLTLENLMVIICAAMFQIKI